jgi:hypothetical protein
MKISVPVHMGALGSHRADVEYYVETNPNGSSWSISIANIFWGPMDIMVFMSSDEIDKIRNAAMTLIEIKECKA